MGRAHGSKARVRCGSVPFPCLRCRCVLARGRSNGREEKGASQVQLATLTMTKRKWNRKEGQPLAWRMMARTSSTLWLQQHVTGGWGGVVKEAL